VSGVDDGSEEDGGEEEEEAQPEQDECGGAGGRGPEQGAQQQQGRRPEALGPPSRGVALRMLAAHADRQRRVEEARADRRAAGAQQQQALAHCAHRRRAVGAAPALPLPAALGAAAFLPALPQRLRLPGPPDCSGAPPGAGAGRGARLSLPLIGSRPSSPLQPGAAPCPQQRQRRPGSGGQQGGEGPAAAVPPCGAADDPLARLHECVCRYLQWRDQQQAQLGSARSWARTDRQARALEALADMARRVYRCARSAAAAPGCCAGCYGSNSGRRAWPGGGALRAGLAGVAGLGTLPCHRRRRCCCCSA
jgi:hypothetical protein